MMPWGHLAVGYLCLSLWTRALTGRPPGAVPTAAVAVATQVPDLVDKPLDIWLLAVPGRSLMHSLVFVVPLCVAVVAVAERRGRRTVGVATALGLLTHLAGDALWPFLSRGLDGPTFLLWPLLPVPDLQPDTVGSYLGLFIRSPLRALSPATPLVNPASVDLALVVVALVVWALDGYPGLERALSRRDSTASE